MEKLEGKNILLIAPKYYEYEREIKKCIESKGARVYMIYENLDRINIFYRAIYVYLKKLKDKAILFYYKKKIQLIRKPVDYVFIIRGSSLSENVMQLLKEKFNQAEFIQYQWDSIASNENAKNLIKWCNRNYTFDFEDARTGNWIYRPLFCAKVSECEKDIDVSFIGTLHTERIKILKKIIDICKVNEYTHFLYLFSNRFVYIKKKYFEHDSRYIGLRDRDIRFKELSLDKTSTVYGRTKVIIDYTAEQTGMTMRTIESLCNGCKLVTNNPYIKNTDLYSEHNVHIYEGVECDFSCDFFQTPFEKLDDKIRKKYSLCSWVNDIFNITETRHDTV